jgi:hypothetical protein
MSVVNYSDPGNLTQYVPYAAAVAAPFVQPLVNRLGEAATNGANAFQNYWNPQVPPAATAQAGPARTGNTAGVPPPATYMPNRTSQVPRMAAGANTLGAASGQALQPSGPIRRSFSSPNMHAINSRSAGNKAMLANEISFSQLINMQPDDFARLNPLEQLSVNNAIMKFSDGSYSRNGRELAGFYWQYSLGPDNIFDPSAANRFISSLDASFRPWLQNTDTKNRYDTIRNQLNKLGEHARRTTLQLKSQFPPIDDKSLRAALSRSYQGALLAVGQPGNFNYSSITAASIHARAKTLQSVADIHHSYHTMTSAGIGGTGKLYAEQVSCPDNGMINWQNEPQLVKLAPGGTKTWVSTSHWFKPGTWGTSAQTVHYPSGVQQQFLNGKVVWVRDDQYSEDGITWTPRPTNPTIESARELAMANYISRQKAFFNNHGAGHYSNCRKDDIPGLVNLQPGQGPL